MIHTIPVISGVLKATSKVFPILLRKHYTAERLSGLIRLEIPASGDGASYYESSQTAACWLMATNLSPFDFSIDRIEVNVTLDAGSFSCTGILPETLRGAETRKIYVRSKCPMTPEAARFAKERSTRAEIGIRAYIVSSIRPFMFSTQTGDVKNFRII